MHTRRTILLIVLLVLAAVVAGAVAAVVVLDPTIGLTVVVTAAALVVLVYVALIEPWHLHWGATTFEVNARMPGDHLLDTDRSSTRAIGIDAPAGDVWPWLVQLGFGRAGWYSYDRIDNDGHPSATTIVPELQQLEPGSVIGMTPELGFTVVHVEPERSIVAQAPDGTTWCLELVAAGWTRSRCRLVSRFRMPRSRPSVGAFLWSAIAGPGSFVMERRMLLGVKRRVEQGRRAHGVPDVRPLAETRR